MRRVGPTSVGTIAVALAFAWVPQVDASPIGATPPRADADEPLPPQAAVETAAPPRSDHSADDPLPPANPRTDADDAAAIDAAATVLIERGRAAEVSNDPGLAAEQWELAYELLGSLPGRTLERNRLGIDLARAHIFANAIDNDATHLRRARDILHATLARARSSELPRNAVERAQIDDAMLLLDVIHSRQPERAQVARPMPPAAVKQREPARLDKPDVDGMVIGGGVGLGLAVVAFAAGAGLRSDARVAGADTYGDYDRRLAQRHRASTAAFAIGGLLLAGGAATLAAGLVLRRRIRAAPSFATDGGGVVIEGRF